MPESDLTLVESLKNCGFTGDEAAVQAESLLRNRNGLLFETSTGSHCDETDSNDSYDSMDGLNLAAMIVRQNSAALNCGLSDHEVAVEAESLVRNRNVRLFDSGGRSDSSEDLNETDSEDSYDVLDHIDLGAMIARQNSAQLNRQDGLQQDCEKDETLEVHRHFIEKKLKDTNNEWRGPADWDADMHANFEKEDRISGDKAYEIAIELGMNSS